MSQQDRLNDELLVLRCQEGDAEAFEAIGRPMAAAIVAARLAVDRRRERRLGRAPGSVDRH